MCTLLIILKSRRIPYILVISPEIGFNGSFHTLKLPIETFTTFHKVSFKLSNRYSWVSTVYNLDKILTVFLCLLVCLT